MSSDLDNFIQQNSPDGGFLQSEKWKKFQESIGRRTYNFAGEGFWANVIEHTLPMVGKYLYVPRGPVVEKQEERSKKKEIQELIDLAKENNAGWIRIEPATEDLLKKIKSNTKYKITKAPHDVQPKEIFIIDITKTGEQLLAEMKAKARYNIRLAGKKEVKIKKQKVRGEYVEEFLKLVKVTATRDKITSHPENYYRTMLETISGDILRLYVAEYEGKVIAANLVVFYGQTCTYLHGASDDAHRNVMAPYLLQWQQIQDAKEMGCIRYDFGGIHTKTGEGITRFKLGFSPLQRPSVFPGSYDIVIKSARYAAYRLIQKGRAMLK